jgi:hypothetical protein
MNYAMTIFLVIVGALIVVQVGWSLLGKWNDYRLNRSANAGHRTATDLSPRGPLPRAPLKYQR